MAKRKARKASARKKSTQKRHSVSTAKLPKDALTLTVILRAREGQETLLEAELRALVGPTRKEEGCLRYDLHRTTDSPAALLLHEIWANRAAHTAHTNTPHFLRWNARKDALLASSDRAFWTQIV